MPLGGKYRLVDIPISNCLNSGLRSIYVLTQFNSMSLHRHIQASYKFDNFSRSFVDILAAQQTPEGSQWYQGTADAVRQNMRYFLERPFDYYIILSGDQLYRMDFRALLHQHIRSGADITLATKPVAREQASEFGIMQSDADRRITRFVEKPKDESVLNEFKMSRELLASIGCGPRTKNYFKPRWAFTFSIATCWCECLENDLVDFGKHIIPQSIQERQVSAYIFDGYWEDIGTIRAFYEANLDLTRSSAAIQFLRRVSADLYASAFSAGQQNQRRDPAPGDHRRRLHHLGRAHGTIGHRCAQHHPNRRDDSEQHRDGSRLLRDRSRRAVRSAECRRLESDAIA